MEQGKEKPRNKGALTRRSFLAWSALAGGTAALAGGLAGCNLSTAGPSLQETGGKAPAGVWKTGACMNNCSCGSSRCLLRVYVEDGVPLKVRTDEEGTESIEVLQRRACPRGRAQINNMLSPARIKYPMKRKGWSPGNPNGQMRGKDEWERISWDEALDYIAAEMKKVIDQYGTKGILCSASSAIGYTYFDQTVCLLDALGGSLHNEAGTISFGSWSVADTHMIGGWGMMNGLHPLCMKDSQLHVLFGCNWVSNKGGNTAYQLSWAREQGSKVIIIDPWLNQTAQALADEWIPILPGTDTALVIGICYHWIENNQYDQEYLDKYTIGFDADHMPEGAPKEENWKDYVLGTYDGEPKTPEWAEKRCNVPAARIRELAEQIAAAKTVNFAAAQSTSKIPAGEQFVQSFYTMALMHGGIGSRGNCMGWAGMREVGAAGLSIGDPLGKATHPVNPLNPTGAPVYMAYPIPQWSALQDTSAWENLEPSECWQSILDGEYGRDIWPGGKKPLDIHAIYFGGYANGLNALPNANAGIKAVRKMDFVWGANPFFDPSRQYCDIVLPVAAWWEKADVANSGMAEVVYWYDQIMPPLFEARTEGHIAEELAKRMGVDPAKVNTMTYKERGFASVQGATFTDVKTGEKMPLIGLTKEDIAEFGVDAEPQEGKITFSELKAKGYYKYPVDPKSDAIPVPYAAFYADPVANPLKTASGKFEIYCAALAFMVNSVGYSQISPIGKWQIGDPQHGHGTQTEEYPLLLWTPHSLRRAHTVDDNVISLREAYPQECFISMVDAQARGIRNGDLVLMSSPHGKVLRPAKVLTTLVPGAVALQDGAWLQIDEATGIDIGGDPNILQAPKASGGGSQSWTATLVQVEKYTGNIKLEPDKRREIVLPQGVE
ncbi:MAG: molybdopterin-dependent oxidoreductase [Coriobacteriaceae bacterium]|jgi:anaerobic dimethyl sulfoxide reductase subunit A|nr:molybdopterin-dependent oxidoreductase [Coriobacteriaceae bacterium]